MTHLKQFWLTRSFLAAIGIAALSSLACAESIEVRVASASDDQEEKLTDRRFPVGHLGSRSSDLELGSESDDQVASMPQAVGLRFRHIDIAPGATINSATIQFTVDEPGNLDTSVVIYGEASPNARTFSTNSFNITSRPQTASFVEWNDIPAWTSVGDAGPAQMSPDLSTIVQEIIDQPDWAANNAMAFVATVTPENYGGQRVAAAYDGNPRRAPLLNIDFTPEPPSLPGDYNNDGLVNVLDIDLQMLAMSDPDPDLGSFDENKDGVVDITDRTILVHDYADTYYGDTNLDGEFNSGDLIAVFNVGEYEDNVAMNSTWATGDWNGDRDFTTGDLVLAFQDAGYEAGPREAVSPIPEPTSVVLLLVGMMGLVQRAYRKLSVP